MGEAEETGFHFASLQNEPFVTGPVWVSPLRMPEFGSPSGSSFFFHSDFSMKNGPLFPIMEAQDWRLADELVFGDPKPSMERSQVKWLHFRRGR